MRRDRRVDWWGSFWSRGRLEVMAGISDALRGLRALTGSQSIGIVVRESA